MLRTHIFLTVIAALFLILPFSASAQTNVLFIVDASGSMKEKVDGKTRIDVAKKVLGETLGEMPEEANLGLLVYGHRKAKDCSDLELVAPIGSEDANEIGKIIQGLKAKGETPIADALIKATKSFKVFKGQQNKIILVTDGLEECKGDPCAAAKKLKDSGLDVAVNIVGFTLGEEDAKKLQCVTEITGGKYYSASNAEALSEALKDVQKAVKETVIVQEAKAPEFDGDLLAEKNGGTLVHAPSDIWLRLNRDHKKFGGPTYAGAGVWSFKDGKAATFSQIEVLVPKAYKYNLKDFEVLASDEMSGPYRSLGEFTVQNIKMMPEGWQGFKFPETTAHFIKVIFKTDQGGGYISGNALKLMGTIDETSEEKEKPEEPDGIDILSEKNGGTLVNAPSDIWMRLNRDHEKFGGPTYAGAAVWSFKGGKTGIFSQIKVLVPGAMKYNLKDFEILASDELSGPYRSLGEFSVFNGKIMPDGWQTFTFPETSARFVKVSFKTDQGGGYVSGNALKLMGSIDEDSSAAEGPAKIEGENLLLEKNGGTLLMGTNDKWNKMSDGSPDGHALYIGEGVWAFKDEKAAIIEAVGALIPGTGSYNLKDFEVFVGDDGPTGDFRSVGTFTAQNLKVLPEGWQMFKIPKVEAKYVKIKALTSHASYITAYEFSVMGNLVE